MVFAPRGGRPTSGELPIPCIIGGPNKGIGVSEGRIGYIIHISTNVSSFAI